MSAMPMAEFGKTMPQLTLELGRWFERKGMTPEQAISLAGYFIATAIYTYAEEPMDEALLFSEALQRTVSATIKDHGKK